MRRSLQGIFYVVMMACATLAGFMFADVTLPLGSMTPQNGVSLPFSSSRLRIPGGAGVAFAVGGVLAGLIIARLLRVNWRAIPYRFRYWLAIQRVRFWWMSTGVASLSVLLFY